MTDALHRLLLVQEQDTVLDQLHHRRESHPLRAELGDLGRHRTELAAALAEVEAELVRLGERQAGLEAEVEAATQRAQAVDRRMYSGEVVASRDLQALADEAESLKGRISHLEDGVLAVMEEREPHDRRAAELAGALAELDSQGGERLAALRRAEAEIDAEEAEHRERRLVLAGDVPGDLLERYEKLRARLGGVAVAELVHGTCGGCHLSLPATELDRIRRAAPDTVLACEQCGRILVRPTA